MDMFERTRRLIGAEAMEKLENARVIVFGLGGVGGSAAEALLRAGVGHLTFVDADCVDETNLNRQIIATRETVGMPKAEAMRARALSIRPDADVDGLSVKGMTVNLKDVYEMLEVASDDMQEIFAS